MQHSKCLISDVQYKKAMKPKTIKSLESSPKIKTLYKMSSSIVI